MESVTLTPEERSARRAERRRKAVRRRRAVALGVVAAAAALGAGVLVGAGGGGDQAPKAAQPLPREPAATAKPVETTKAAERRSALGSGKSVTFAFGGDVHFESPIAEKLAASPSTLLDPIAPVLRRADVAMVNLETAITDRGSPQAKAYTFRGPPSGLDALKAAGVDVASIANNHGLDYGVTGLYDTLRAGRRAGLPVVGGGANDTRAYAPFRTTVRGQRIAIIGATQVLDDELISAWTAGPGKPGLASAKEVDRLVQAVAQARRTSDTVVVFLHWGIELQTCPSGDQQELARRLVAAGADLVVGGHAHVLQGAGRMGKALVAYGLGNFVFYAFREITSQTGVLEVKVTGRRIDGYQWLPARISGGIPYPLSGSDAGQARASWRALRGCTGLRP